MGWAGGILAAELTKSGLKVVGLERGPTRRLEDEVYVKKHDELRFRVRHGLMQDTSKETWTLRHDLGETALPIRQLGAFRPGSGVGGASVHYGGLLFRYLPDDFQLRSHVISRYGEHTIPEDSTIQDWGINYSQLEPYYDRFEYMAGVAGRAGNVGGEITAGGNPFEGARARHYPLPPMKDGLGPTMFREAAANMSLHPYPIPGGTLSERYTNPDGISRSGCSYCGSCAFHPCAIGAKADAVVTVLPVAARTGLFELRTGANVFRVERNRGRATSVVYWGADGTEYEQPASVIILSAYTFNNVRLLLLSGIGRPYDPVSGTGVVGKNYAFHFHSSVTGFFAAKNFKRYMGSNSVGYAVDDFHGANLNYGDVGFIGGGLLMSSVGAAAPITGLRVPPGTPSWGAEWKAAIRAWFDRALDVTCMGDVLAYRTNYLDLDPIYSDARGVPLLRITFDWHPNERKIASYMAERARDLLTTLTPDYLAVNGSLPEHFDSVPYQSSHNVGGAIMGADPATSVVNDYLQMWDCENVWVVGGSAFPQLGSHGPTGTIGALAYRAADAIVEYSKSPRLLA